MEFWKIVFVFFSKVCLSCAVCTYSFNGSDCDIDTGTIVGIVIGGIIALVIIVFVILLACSYIKMLDRNINEEVNDEVSQNPAGRRQYNVRQTPRYTSVNEVQSPNVRL